MTQQAASGISKAELLEALRACERDVAEKLGALPAEEFEKGRYEGGWNGRQILAHVASIEWTLPRLIEIAKEASSGAERPRPEAPAASAGFRGGNADYNTRQVEKRAGASVAELIEEFRTNRAALIAAIEAADDALLDVPVRSAGGVPGPLARVYQILGVVHVMAHVNDIAGR
jgi:hypothetical protein